MYKVIEERRSETIVTEITTIGMGMEEWERMTIFPIETDQMLMKGFMYSQ